VAGHPPGRVGRASGGGRPLAHPVAHLRYPGAGHAGVGVPGTPAPTEVRQPVDGASYALGGMPAANAAARADSWPQVLAFLAAAGS
jgi:hypothetical protein